MRIDIKRTKVYHLDELSDGARQAALESLYNINIDHDWWDSIYDGAAGVLLELTGFDIGRGNYCKGEFMEGAEDTANKIKTDHGGICETYKTATEYLTERGKLVEKYSDGVNTDIVAEDNEYDFDVDCNELDDEFLESILEDYRILLSKEYEYFTSEESIIETIEANEYEFTEDGKIY